MRSFFTRIFLIRGASSSNFRQLAPPRLLAPPSVIGTSRLFYFIIIIIIILYYHPKMCSVCPSQKLSIVETCHDPINQVTLYIFTLESRRFVIVLSIWQKGGTPPKKHWPKGGLCFSPTATSMFSVKSTPSQNLQRLASSLDTSQPSRVFFFFASV